MENEHDKPEYSRNKRCDEKQDSLVNSTITGMAQDTLIQKHGEGASQMIQALKGKRYDTSGKEIDFKGRSLEKISNYKIDANNPERSIKQQAGFSAELIKEARDNKEAILSGSKNRTRTTDGQGMTNHTQYDHVVLDENGNVISGSGSQMKFLGQTKGGKYTVVENVVNNPDWERYDTVIDVPADKYQDYLEYADKCSEKLKQQAEYLKKQGKYELAEQKDAKAQKYQDAKKKLRRSNVKEREAISARTAPERFVAKEVFSDSHKAGVEAAKGALIYSGSISVAQNLYAVIREEKSMDEAAKDVTVTIAETGAASYITGSAGTTLKAIMHSSKSEAVRKIGTTNAATIIATAAVETTKSISKYARGDLNETELIEELGEKGIGMVAAGFASAAGALALGAALPAAGLAAGVAVTAEVGATIGSFIGSMIGYSSSSVLYKGALDVLKSSQLSGERRKIIEDIADKSIKDMEEYRKELKNYSNSKYLQREKAIADFFSGLETSILDNDIGEYINCVNDLAEVFGIKLQFSSDKELEEFILDPDSVLIL